LSAEIFVTRFPSTVTSMPHEARQYLQNVCTVLASTEVTSTSSPNPNRQARRLELSRSPDAPVQTWAFARVFAAPDQQRRGCAVRGRL
jgi:hypothetical protein